ncbi:MAG: hypothetical protein ABIV36_10245 [Sphingobium limneticum]
MGELHILPPLGEEPLAPMASPIMHLDDGTAWVPNAFVAGAYGNVPICVGGAMGWQPVQEVEQIVLVFQGGNPTAPTGEIVAAALSRRGLRALVRDLQSIDRQWGAD